MERFKQFVESNTQGWSFIVTTKKYGKHEVTVSRSNAKSKEDAEQHIKNKPMYKKYKPTKIEYVKEETQLDEAFKIGDKVSYGAKIAGKLKIKSGKIVAIKPNGKIELNTGAILDSSDKVSSKSEIEMHRDFVIESVELDEAKKDHFVYQKGVPKTKEVVHRGTEQSSKDWIEKNAKHFSHKGKDFDIYKGKYPNVKPSDRLDYRYVAEATVNELSKKTLGSYIKKADKQADKASDSYSRAAARRSDFASDTPAMAKNAKKFAKRDTGAALARKKLANQNESVDLDEVTVANSTAAFDLKKKAEAYKRIMAKSQQAKGQDAHDKFLKARTSFMNALKKLKQMDLPKAELDALRKGTNISESVDLDEDTINSVTANYINENDITLDQLENMTEEELNELIGKAIGGAFKVGAKAAVGAARLAGKAANRMTAAGRADAAEKKADSMEKKNKDRERIKAAQDRLRKAKEASRNK